MESGIEPHRRAHGTALTIKSIAGYPAPGRIFPILPSPGCDGPNEHKERVMEPHRLGVKGSSDFT